MIDKTKVCNNIRAILKQRDIKIGEFENCVGVPVGYLSKNRLSVDALYAISKELGISMERLIEDDFANEFKKAKLEDEIKKLRAELAELGGKA
jgi:transcriptional regulator with XRE-family HTH domain